MNEASRDLQIPRQLGEMQATIESLAKSIESLSMRLSKVCSPESPQVDGNMKGGVTVMCEYVEVLENKTTQLKRLRDIIVSIESRLEL